MTGTPVTGALEQASYTLDPAGQAVPPVARTHTIPPPTPELLTESFCERCGTRYTFESAAPKARRPGLGRARVLTRGLKNWVVEDGRSIEAAMADARRDEDRTLASAQLEAFHQTFNFCMDCRQYTCTDCWNQAEGRCLSCAPMPGQLEAEAAAAAVAEHAAAHAAVAAATNGAEAESAWPTVDLTADEAAEPAGAPAAAEAAATAPVETEGAAVPYMPTDLRPVELPDDDVEMMVGAADVAAEAVVAEAVATEDEPVARAEETIEPEAVAEGVPAALVEAAAEPIAAAVEPIAAAEPEPMAAEPEATPAVEAEPTPAAPVTRTPAPGWTIVAPDAPGDAPTARPAWPPRAPVYQPPAQAPAPKAPAPGQPEQPAWPTLPPAAFSVPAAQVVWEESSLGVINRPGSGVQACVSCGLPLSATARFCRRCGSRQG